MNACPSCGSGYEGSFKFCPECGADLIATRRLAEERKVVTSLFCDLVGFTAASETADPEDVDRMLAGYFAMAKAQIEAYGGVVEKFIGDAVVGVFGVPAAHEDDPERAVRAGLRIAEDAQGLQGIGGGPLRLRVGINTGEALVRLGVSPASGEGFLTGDAVNTASRIQSVAPEMGVAVGLATYETTSVVFEYEELGSATLKGKSEPVRVFHAKAPRARLGTDLTRTHTTPYIGRELDLALLKGTFERTVASEEIQLVTIVGEPGLGKSRIVAEFGAYVDRRPELTTWRQGRCLPYGDGITFWALGEIVKAHAGILESDTPDLARVKLDIVLPEGAERAWFRQRLLPLLGIDADQAAGRDEQFTAWTRFLQQIAEQHPTVLVFEDLHWADDAMLAFLEHLARRAQHVPLLVIGTARPELFERRPDHGAGLPNATRIALTPLSEGDTVRLVSALLGSPVVPAEVRRLMIDRSAGNPLYAEESVRLLKDRDLIVRVGANWELRQGAELPFPDSVQSLIAARLDTLAPDERSILADAAVVGKVFWAGAVAAMGEADAGRVTETLRDLSEKELVRPAPRSSMEGEDEYAFWHALARDVAYARLPRASRAARHVAAARWIGSRAPERVQDLAEVLAYHYGTALELSLAAGQIERASELEAPTLRFLTLAGERAVGLDNTAALANFERALALTPPGHPARPDVLVRFAQAAYHSGRITEAAEASEEAVEAFRAAVDPTATARAMLQLAHVYRSLGDARRWTLVAEALAILEPLPPGPELVEALQRMGALASLQGNPDAAISYADRALTTAQVLGLDRPAAAIGWRGKARVDAGDSGGLEDERDAIELAIRSGQGNSVPSLYNNLAVSLRSIEGPPGCLAVVREAIAFAQTRGLSMVADTLTSGMLEVLFEVGELDEALAVGTVLAERLGEEDVFDLLEIRATLTRILSLRGDPQATGWLDWLETTCRATGAVEDLLPALASTASIRATIGQTESALAILAEVESTPRTRGTTAFPGCLSEMVRTAISIGALELAGRFVAGLELRDVYMEHALVAANAALMEAAGDLRAAADAYADAADRWKRFGLVAEHGFTLLGRGRCLVGLAGSNGASAVLMRSREIFERLGAMPALAETDALLQRANATGS